jgi:hypothetical protein
MMIRKECLGVSFSKKSPHNGCHFTGVITDNPENFALYKVLQLDVFESNIPPMATVWLTEEKTTEVLTEIWEKQKPKSKKKKD